MRYLFLSIFILFIGCTTTHKRVMETNFGHPSLYGYSDIAINFKNKKKRDKKKIKKEENYPLSFNDRKKLVKYALKFDKVKKFSKTKKFRNDCSGFVKFIFHKFDIDLYELPISEIRRGKTWLGGAEVIYRYAKKNGRVFKKSPNIGDFIFFDNTADRNRDKKVNDLFTHIAIITDIDKNGTIFYIHKSNRGVNIQRMNIKYPDKNYIKLKNGKKIKVNSYLRKKRKGDKKNTPYLSGKMFRSFGTIFKSK